MPELTPLYTLLAHLCPLDCMQSRFMQQALLALLLLAPMTAAMGILVVNFRMAFFAEAISHSAFTGVALGMLLTVSPELTMPLFGRLTMARPKATMPEKKTPITVSLASEL